MDGTKIELINETSQSIAQQPNQYATHPHQVAGHGILLQDNERGLVLKPVMKAEFEFYENIFSTTKEDEALKRIKKYIPEYYGSVTINGVKYLQLKNLTHSMKQPCVLDLKMGTQQHTNDMPKEKIKIAIRKCQQSTTAKLGVRITGMKIYDPNTNGYTELDREEGRNIGEEIFLEQLGRFFLKCPGLVHQSLDDLRQLREIIGQLRGLYFISSSLLFGYDLAHSDRFFVKMIDFGHSCSLEQGTRIKDSSDAGPDVGYLLGLESVIRQLESIQSTLKV
eukprot:TRINITY_DN5122_c0_g1_i1.p1 TRINITY_DN5122_c0_g1~~TRINITY_DN5122_c0_g1_i1.p1  ORF type:complete len:279 (+),score=45.24 TRINITY_DN5122_c0_g1_i1:46-882(+)